MLLRGIWELYLFLSFFFDPKWRFGSCTQKTEQGQKRVQTKNVELEGWTPGWNLTNINTDLRNVVVWLAHHLFLPLSHWKGCDIGLEKHLHSPKWIGKEMGPLQTKELFVILYVSMHEIPCVEWSDFEYIYGCYFLHGYSEGAKDRFAAQSLVQGQVLGLKEEMKSLIFWKIH